MTRGKLKEDLLHHMQSVMAQGGLEARAEWNGGKGVIRAGIPDTESWAFHVNVRIEGETVAVIGIVRPEEDEVRDDLPWNRRRKHAVYERSFRQGPGDERERQRFGRALREEVQAYEAQAKASDVASGRDALAGELREMIERDPDGAADAIAGLLAERLGRYDLDGLKDDVADANSAAPQP